MRPNQRAAFKIIAREGRSLTLEAPVGSGKTAIEYAFLKAHERAGVGPLFWIAPTKNLVEQFLTLHQDPSLWPAMGRNEHRCLYYPDKNLRADQIPCLLLKDCAHRVNQQTGETHTAGAVPCPYLLQKYAAKQSGGIVVCTMAFFLFTQFYSKEWEPAAAIAVDESHNFASAIRTVLSFEMSDWHIGRAVRLLREFATDQGEILAEFLQQMIDIIRSKSPRTLLVPTDIQTLMDILMRLSPSVIEERISAAIALGQINPDREREVLNHVQTLIRDLRRYLAAFGYSLETESRHALNYMYAEWVPDTSEHTRVLHKLVVKIHYVNPIVRRLLPPNYLACSATIRVPDAYRYETGIDGPVYSLPSDFPPENTRVFQPTDTPDLTFRTRGRREPRRVMRRIVRLCRQLNSEGHRFLMITVSEAERRDFARMCGEEKVEILTYGNGLTAREVTKLFREGQGRGLLGTEANLSEGIDLPDNTVPFIFYLRPGYPSPGDPLSEFERRRFGRQLWQVWRWRAIVRALQTRGRNIRSATDRGVTIFVSQQFRHFIPGALPEELRPSFRGNLTLEECLGEARQLIASSD